MSKLTQELRDSLLSQEQKKYLLLKSEAFKKEGIPDDIAEKLAVEEFRHETLLSLQEIQIQSSLE